LTCSGRFLVHRHARRLRSGTTFRNCRRVYFLGAEMPNTCAAGQISRPKAQAHPLPRGQAQEISLFIPKPLFNDAGPWGARHLHLAGPLFYWALVQTEIAAIRRFYHGSSKRTIIPGRGGSAAGKVIVPRLTRDGATGTSEDVFPLRRADVVCKGRPAVLF